MWQTQKCVGDVCVCVYMCFFPPAPPSRGCPSCQSCSVCVALWTEACSGRNLGRHSSPTEVICTDQTVEQKPESRETLQHVLQRECVGQGHRQRREGLGRTLTGSGVLECSSRSNFHLLLLLDLKLCDGFLPGWNHPGELTRSSSPIFVCMCVCGRCLCFKSLQVDAADGQ